MKPDFTTLQYWRCRAECIKWNHLKYAAWHFNGSNFNADGFENNDECLELGFLTDYPEASVRLYPTSNNQFQDRSPLLLSEDAAESFQMYVR